MSEAAAPTPAPAPVDGITAGMLLREAREAAGLHVATLAANLKVPVRKLEALEEDRYDLLGDAVFVRGLASSICRTLKVDPQPVLQRLPQTASPRLVQEGEGINAPFRAPGDGPSPGLLDQVSRPVVLIVVALLLGALAIMFLPMAQRGYETIIQSANPEPAMPPQDAAATVPSAPGPVEAPPVTVEPALAPTPAATPPAASTGVAPPVTAPVPAPRAAASVPSGPAARPAASAAAPAPARPVASAAPVPVAAPQESASGAIAARGTVQFRTHGRSWIQVTDATGNTVFQRLMEAGESAGAFGNLPLSVVIGNVEATEVQVRGKPYSLAAVARDNVARFEVK